MALALASSSAFSACLVSFEDYPTGDIGAGAGANTTMAGTNQGGVGGGSGGSAGKGGKGGTSGGGTSGAASGGSATVEDMIDDFEDNDPQIPENNGRMGSWYSAGDFYGSQEPDTGALSPALLPMERDGSTRALHVRGDGYTVWGSLMRTSLNQPPDGSFEPWDASAYAGIKFWGRSGDGDAHDVRVTVPTVDTDSDCTTCNDHFGNDLVFNGDWQEFTLPFAQMSQANWGEPQLPQVDETELTGVQVSFAIDADYDVWFDDVRFYK